MGRCKWVGVAFLVVALLAVFGYVAYNYYPEKVHDLKMMLQEKIHKVWKMTQGAMIFSITSIYRSIKKRIETGIEKFGEFLCTIFRSFRNIFQS